MARREAFEALQRSFDKILDQTSKMSLPCSSFIIILNHSTINHINDSMNININNMMNNNCNHKINNDISNSIVSNIPLCLRIPAKRHKPKPCRALRLRARCGKKMAL